MLYKSFAETHEEWEEWAIATTAKHQRQIHCFLQEPLRFKFYLQYVAKLNGKES